MSLITEALKKADKERQSETSDMPQKPVEEKSLTEAEQEGESPSRGKVFGIVFGGGTLLLALLILVFVYFVKPSLGRSRNVPAPITISEGAAPAVMEPVAEVVPEVSKEMPAEEAVKMDIVEQSEVDAQFQDFKKEEVAQNSVAAAEPKKGVGVGINQEMFESFVGVAQKFIAPKAAGGGVAPEAAKETEKPVDYTVKNAKELLEQINQEKATAKVKPVEAVAVDEADEVQSYVDSLNITGVMFNRQDSKVLINNRVFSINSVVNRDYRLMLRQIEPHTLVFTDDSGRRYTKEF